MANPDLAGSFMVYHDENGVAFPVFNMPASAHSPPIPAIPVNRAVLAILRKNFPETGTAEPDYKGFALAIMDGWPQPHGEMLDGLDLQELAEKHGLLRREEMQVPCGEVCQCFEYNDAGDTVTCYRINWERA